MNGDRLLGTRRTLSNLVLLALIILLSSGCGDSGPELAPVSGTVLLDGKPVEGASVTFMPAAGGRPATGTTNASGEFQLTTFKEQDGALVGDHSVTITLVKRLYWEGMTTDQEKVKWLIPKRYGRVETSELHATVPCPEDRVTFELKSE